MDNATNPNPALTQSMVSTPPMRVLLYRDLEPRKGIPFSRQQIRNLIKDKEFPAPMNIGKHTIAWFDSEIDAFLIARAAARPAA